MKEHSIQCQACRRRRSTIHWWYGHGADTRVAHFCHLCAEGQRPGHTALAESRFDPVWMLKLYGGAALVVVALVRWLRA